MKTLWVALLPALVVSAGSGSLFAQTRGFVTLGVTTGLNRDYFAGPGGGALFAIGDSPVSVGAKGDLFFSNGYASGRGGPVVQATFNRARPVRPFVIGGIAWGEESGYTFGGGLEIWGEGRLGFRAGIQDYKRRYGSHQQAFEAGLTWK